MAHRPHELRDKAHGQELGISGVYNYIQNWYKHSWMTSASMLFSLGLQCVRPQGNTHAKVDCRRDCYGTLFQ